jgi:dihydroflavonol-4-reductase
MMKALVTGGTGFVGSHVARALADAGHEVRVLHRPSSKMDALAGVQYESVLGDILDEDVLRAACHTCDRVFHVAAVSDYWRVDRTKMFDANVRGTHLVLRAARAAGVQRVVFTSSAAAVGTRADGSLADEQDTFNLLPERFPYGYSKALAERVVGEAVADGQDVVIVNPVVVLGPGDLNVISGDFVLKTRRLRWTLPVPPGGVAVTDVRDVARWHIAAAERGRTGERYILATENFAYHRWFALIADVVGVRAPAFPLPRFALPLVAAAIDFGRNLGLALPVDANQVRLGARRIYFRSDKAWAELGAPQVTMRQSLVDTYNWYQSHGYVQEDWLARIIATLERF